MTYQERPEANEERVQDTSAERFRSEPLDHGSDTLCMRRPIRSCLRYYNLV
jgi:hypothetical protein